MDSLSIIVPVRGAAAYLAPAFASLAASAARCKRFAVEAVAVNDGSDAETGRALEAVSARPETAGSFRSFKILSIPPSGTACARNAGLDAASGAWVGFMDADDLVAPHWLNALEKTLENAPEAETVNLLPPVHFKEGSAPAFASGDGGPSRLRVFGGDAARRRLAETALRDGWCWANFFRRDRLRGVRFPPGMRFKEDMIFLLDAARGIENAAFSTFRGYGHRLHAASASGTVTDGDSVRFVDELGRLAAAGGLGMDGAAARRAFGRALAGDFVRWTFSKTGAPYDASSCPVLARWREAGRRGELDLRGAKWWWRTAIRRWMASGDLRPALRIRRLRTFLERG